MIDIRQKLDEIGPFVPGADDGLLVCRCIRGRTGKTSRWSKCDGTCHGKYKRIERIGKV